MAKEKEKISIFDDIEENTHSDGTFLVFCKSFLEVDAIPNLTVPIIHLLLKDNNALSAELIGYGEEAISLNVNVQERQIYSFQNVFWEHKRFKERISWEDTFDLIGHYKKESLLKCRTPEFQKYIEQIENLTLKKTPFTSLEVRAHFPKFVAQFMINHAECEYDRKNEEKGRRRVSEFITSDGVAIYITGFDDNLVFTDDLEIGEVYEMEDCVCSIDKYTRIDRITLTYTCFSSFTKIESKSDQTPMRKVTLKEDFSKLDGKNIEIDLVVRGSENLSAQNIYTVTGLDGSMFGKFAKSITVEYSSSYGLNSHDYITVKGTIRNKGSKHSILASSITQMENKIVDEKVMAAFKHPLKFV